MKKILIAVLTFQIISFFASALVINNNEISEPFEVLDQPAGAYGEYKHADKIYHNAAAKVKATCDGKIFTVKFICPIPKGMKVDKDDYVGFFFTQNPKRVPYFHYTVNSSGKISAKKYIGPANPKVGWSSNIKASVKNNASNYEVTIKIPASELEIKDSSAGKIAYGNFTRNGKTAGGLSTWAPVGREYHSPLLFGELIFGSRADRLKLILKDLEKTLYSISGNGKLKEAAERKLNSLKQAINNYDNTPDLYEDLLEQAQNLNFNLTGVKNHTNFMVWECNLWENDFTVNKNTKPLEKLKITVPQNAQAVFGLALTNFEKSSYLGRIKWFTKYNKHNFDDGSHAPYTEHLKLFEMVKLCNLNNLPVYDPLIPLALNSVVQVPSGNTVPLLARINSKGLKPGVYKGQLAFKSSLPQFKTILIPFELKVIDVDLSLNKPDGLFYSYTFHRWNSPKNKKMLKMYSDFGASIVNFQFPGQGNLSKVYPILDSSGNPDLSTIDMSQFDSAIDRSLAAGFPKDKFKIMLDLHCVTHTLMRNGKRPKFEPESESYSNAVGKTFNYWLKHWEKKYGITKDRVLFMPLDEASGDIDKKDSRIYYSYAFAKMLKKIDPKFQNIMTCTMTYSITPETLKKNLKLVAPYFDVFMPLAWYVKPEFLTMWKGKKLWAYLVLDNNTNPFIYRRLGWLNFRNGMDGTSAFWHMEEQAGGDGFEFFTGWANGIRSNYGAAYADFHYGEILSSRRMEAHRLGVQEWQLMDYCKNKIANRSDAKKYKKRLDKIVQKSINLSNNAALVNGRNELMKLAEELSR